MKAIKALIKFSFSCILLIVGVSLMWPALSKFTGVFRPVQTITLTRNQIGERLPGIVWERDAELEWIGRWGVSETIEGEPKVIVDYRFTKEADIEAVSFLSMIDVDALSSIAMLIAEADGEANIDEHVQAALFLRDHPAKASMNFGGVRASIMTRKPEYLSVIIREAR